MPLANQRAGLGGRCRASSLRTRPCPNMMYDRKCMAAFVRAPFPLCAAELPSPGLEVPFVRPSCVLELRGNVSLERSDPGAGFVRMRSSFDDMVRMRSTARRYRFARLVVRQSSSAPSVRGRDLSPILFRLASSSRSASSRPRVSMKSGGLPVGMWASLDWFGVFLGCAGFKRGVLEL